LKNSSRFSLDKKKFGVIILNQDEFRKWRVERGRWKDGRKILLFYNFKKFGLPVQKDCELFRGFLGLVKCVLSVSEVKIK